MELTHLLICANPRQFQSCASAVQFVGYVRFFLLESKTAQSQSSILTGAARWLMPSIAMCVLATALSVGPPYAQVSEPSLVIEEIVVTARKREESLQDVPLSVTAFDANAIEDAFGENIGEFSKMAPNVTLAR